MDKCHGDFVFNSLRIFNFKFFYLFFLDVKYVFAGACSYFRSTLIKLTEVIALRRHKRASALTPYMIGLGVGYAAAILICAAAALVLSFSNAAAKAAGAAAVVAMSIGSFLCGRMVGRIKHRDGLKTGSLAGLMYSVLPVLLSLIFGSFGTAMLFVKPLLCVFFGAAGGVAGVNSGSD